MYESFWLGVFQPVWFFRENCIFTSQQSNHQQKIQKNNTVDYITPIPSVHSKKDFTLVQTDLKKSKKLYIAFLFNFFNKGSSFYLYQKKNIKNLIDFIKNAY